jgi:ubiquitin carboxyl-terminal hydrolase 34
MCCYRDVNNFEKLNDLVQVILSKAIGFIKRLPEDCEEEENPQQPENHEKNEEESGSDGERQEEKWTLEEKERLFTFAGKVFTSSFPIYVAYKHTVHSSLDELSSQEAAALNNICELSVSMIFSLSLCTSLLKILLQH